MRGRDHWERGAGPAALAQREAGLKPNRSGVYIIFNGPGMDSLTTQFQPAANAWPASAGFEVSVEDPQGKYLPRRAQVQAPQAVTQSSDPASVLHPQRVAMYRAPSAAVEPNWAVIYASVANAPWAVLRVLRASDSAVLATGMADARGETLLAVPGVGIQVNANGGGAVLRSTVPVMVEAFFDPAAPKIPDPDDILKNLPGAWRTGRQPAELGAGRTLFLNIAISD